MKSISILLFLWVSLVQFGCAQSEQRAAMTIGKIFGQVIDSTSNQAVEFATVSIIRLRNDSIISGGITNKKGQFLIENLPMGIFRVEVDFIGYKKTTIKRVPIIMNRLEQDLGKILLAETSTNLEMAEVTADRPFMTNSIDRKIFNVESIITAEGGSATELLENIPSVEVDIDGNVSLRGSGNVNILIDGKPSGLTGASRTAILEQIPANTIASIEVITNPSAKFDPDGMAGIINIVLKKNQKPGWNGTVSAGIGTQGQYNGSVNLNMRTSKYNIYGTYGLRIGNFNTNSSTFRNNFLSDDLAFLIQEQEGQRGRNAHLVRGGIDVYLNPKTTFSLGGTYSYRNGTSEGLLITEEQNAAQDIQRYYTRDNFNERPGGSYDVRATLQKKFAKEKQELIIDVNYSDGVNDRTGQYFETETVANGTLLMVPDILETQDQNNGSTTITTLQADYVHPLDKRSRLETGLKTILRDLGSEFAFETFDPLADAYVVDLNQSNQFDYSEQIHAAYVTYAREVGKFSFQAGLRAEQAFTESVLVTTGEVFENDYFSLFPTLHTAYELPKDQEVMFSYSRRINRPSVRSLNPFTNFADPLNLRSGNPFLNPEYINSLELGYSKFWKGTSVTANVYYKGIEDIIQRFKTIDDEGVSITTFENLASGRNYGLELISRVTFNKKWNANASVNVFRTEVDGSNVEGDLNNDAFGASIRLMNTNQLWKNGDLQLTTFWRSPRPIAQGRIDAFYAVNLAIRQRFLDRKASITLRVRDLFNTMQFEFVTEADNFYQESARRRQSRIFNLAFSYRFGKMQRNANRRRSNGRQNGGNDNGGSDFEID
ncbi:MAG: TonB-dependent receptor family protein [Bacteroidota bacterium]